MDSKAAMNEGVTFLDTLVLLLSLYVLVQLIVESCFVLDPGVTQIFDYGDYFVSVVFLTDFITRFRKAPSKLAFMRLGWIDLLSSLPTANWLMLSRFVRILRLLRIIRALRSAKTIIRLLLRNPIRNAFVSAAIISVIMLITCGSAMLSLEKDAKGANIRTAEDAVWWAASTVTTVGYGDKYPTTLEGRIVAVILMITGVGLFSTFSGTMAAMLLSPHRNNSEEVLQEINALRSEIEQLRSSK
jgi:voltage-gated potassium channel